jgi:hypothetical protein
MEATKESLDKFPPAAKPVATAPTAVRASADYPPLEPQTK